MADMVTTRRAIRLSDEHWAILQGLSMRLVHDSEMPKDARPDAGRVSQLFRLVASGDVICYRPGAIDRNSNSDNESPGGEDYPYLTEAEEDQIVADAAYQDEIDQGVIGYQRTLRDQ